MKKSLYILFLILFLVSCKQPQSNDFSQENIIEDTFVQKTDTLTKISEPFKVNDIECYWKVSIIIEEGDFEGGNITRELINNETQKTILRDTDFAHIDHYKEIDFEKEKENFKDVNFDGFKDCLVFNSSNTPMPYNFFYNIYIFNSSTKSFDFSDELSGTEIEIDSVNRKIISRYLYMGRSSKTIHHFDKNSTIKFSEIFIENTATINDSIYTSKRYEKIINGEVVETQEE